MIYRLNTAEIVVVAVVVVEFVMVMDVLMLV
jgi:hypothetical protein